MNRDKIPRFQRALRIRNPWRRIPQSPVSYSGGPPKTRSKFLYFLTGFFPFVFRQLVLKFGSTGSEVDVKDDSLDRWYVRHYKYDPDRKQVRHVFLKAFSNQKGQMRYFTLVNEGLQDRKLVEDVPRHEHISGGHYEPGYHARVRENRRQNGGVGSTFVRYEPIENQERKSDNFQEPEQAS